MQPLATLRLKTGCDSCVHKCCSQPYDWVFLTVREIYRLVAASGRREEEFVTNRQNSKTGHLFRTLNLPCTFLDTRTGQCTVYEARPLVCRLFPFYIEPLTGHATLLPVQCGDNLHFVPLDSDGGWCLLDFQDSARQWLAEIWDEAIRHD